MQVTISALKKIVVMQYLLQLRTAINRLRHGGKLWRMRREPLSARPPTVHRGNIAIQQRDIPAQGVRRGSQLLFQP